MAGNEGRCQDLSKEVNASATTEADCGTVRPPSSSAVSKRTRSKTKKQSPRLAVNKARSRFACYGGGSRSRLSRELVNSDTPVCGSQPVIKARTLVLSSTREHFLSSDLVGEPSWDPSAVNPDVVFHQVATPTSDHQVAGSNRSRPASPERLNPVDRPVTDRQPTPGKRLGGINPLGGRSLSLPQSPTSPQTVLQPAGGGVEADQLVQQLVELRAMVGGSNEMDEGGAQGGGTAQDGDATSEEEIMLVDPNSPEAWTLRARDIIILTSMEFAEFDPTHLAEEYLVALTTQLNDRKMECMDLFTKLSRVPEGALTKKRLEDSTLLILDALRKTQQRLTTLRQQQMQASAATSAPTAGVREQGGVHSRVSSRADTASPAPSSVGSRFSEATLNFKRQRVETQSGQLDTDISDLIAEMRGLLAVNPDSDKQAKEFADRTSNLVRRVASLDKEAGMFCQDALDVDMADKAGHIDEGACKMRTSLRDLEYKSETLKSTRGITGLSDMKGVDLAPPTFSGEAGEDVYDFLETLEQFVDSRSYSKAQILRMVKLTCLKGQVQKTCKYMDQFSDVKKHLVDVYGQPRVLFDAKLKVFSKIGKCPAAPAAKVRDWYIDVLQQLKELVRIAAKYHLNDDLRHSQVMTVIHSSLTSRVETDFLAHLTNKGISCVDKAAVFQETLAYLEELVTLTTEKVNYHLMIGVKDVERVVDKQGQRRTYAVDTVPIDECSPPASPKAVPRKQKQQRRDTEQDPGVLIAATKARAVTCVGCESKHTYHFECKQFQAATIKERFVLTKTQGSCMRCLRMDAGVDVTNRRAWWEGHKEDCVSEWFCTTGWCKNSTPRQQQHVLMCGGHQRQNKQRVDEFVKAQDKNLVPPSTRFYFSQFNLSTAAAAPNSEEHADYEIVRSSKFPAIYLLQDVFNIKGEKLTLFFDTGCSAAAISEQAAEIIGTKNLRPGPTKLTVAGGSTLTIRGGVDSFLLDLFKPKTKAELEGLVMPEVTSPLDLHRLSSAYLDICESYEEEFGDLEGLPTVPESVGGGRVDIMVGILYPHLFPEKVFSLNCGLEIYRTPIKTLSGHHGVLGGPHHSWERANARADYMNPTAFLTAEMRAYRAQANALYFTALPDGPVATVDHDMVSSECDWTCSGHHCSIHQDISSWSVPDHWYLPIHAYPTWEDRMGFEQGDKVATEVSYRCMRCRNCADCRKGEYVEAVSLQEEIEQAMIESSVWLDLGDAVLRCKLPFTKDPVTHLADNRKAADRMFSSQLKAISRNPAMKEAVIKAHDKLLSKGHVCRVDELTPEAREIFNTTKGGYVIPWSCVTKLESVSTPYRIVFNASHKTKSGESLNSILAKGSNRLPHIFQLLVKFSSDLYAFTADVSMAYNSVKLAPEHYKYQQYYWRPTMDPDEETALMVIKTLIYGVKSSGNLTQAGFEKAAHLALQTRPDLAAGANVILNNTYVDDTVAAEPTLHQCKATAAAMQEVLAAANVVIKDFTFSGSPPSDKVSANGVTVGVLGYTWDPVKELVTLAPKPTVLGNSRRGKKPLQVSGDLRTALEGRFTKRILTGQLAGVFDPRGLVTPITAQYKLHLSKVVDLKTGWDEPLPLDLIDTWSNLISEIQLLQSIQFPRCFIHPEAIDSKVELVVSVDSSQYVAVAAVHARTELADGTFGCRLVAGKSKLTKLATIPRGELKAAVMGASLAHAVTSTLRDQVKRIVYVTDSTIVLFWLHQDARPLQTAVRNGVIEVRRLTNLKDWYHVPSEANIADLGTREASIDLISETSEWVNGKPWMQADLSEGPLRSVDEVHMDQEDVRTAMKEVRAAETCAYNLPQVVDKLEARYTFSKYIVDPCVLAWNKAVRVLAFVLQFLAALKAAVTRGRTKPARSKEPTRFQPPRSCKRAKSPKQGQFFTRTYRVSFECSNSLKDFRLSECFLDDAERYFFKKASLEVKQFSKKADYKDCSIVKDGILTYVGRILDNQEIEDLDNVLGEVTPLFFSRPIVDRYSPIAYSVMEYVHSKVMNHKNAVATLRESRSLCFILHGRDLANEIVEACVTCRRSKAKKVEQDHGKQHPATLAVTPAFYRAQVDLAGPWWATCEHTCRSAVKVWAVVFRDPATCATAIYAMQASTSSAFIQAYSRHSFRYGHPRKLYIDAGSQLMKACKEASFTWHNVHAAISGQYNVGIEYEVCPPHAHYFHGAVERSIQEMKRILNAVFDGFKLSLFGYETAFQFCANQMNDVPICVGSRTDHLGNRDVLTPNRLLLGRNNKRAPASVTSVDAASTIVEQMEAVEKAWWQVWASERLEDFIPAPKKWKKVGKPVKIGDIVLFPIKKPNSELAKPAWKTGKIVKIADSHDGAVRRVIVLYRNDEEEFNREVERGVRELAVLHSEDDFELRQQLAVAARHVHQGDCDSGEPAPPTWEIECMRFLEAELGEQQH